DTCSQRRGEFKEAVDKPVSAVPEEWLVKAQFFSQQGKNFKIRTAVSDRFDHRFCPLNEVGPVSPVEVAMLQRRGSREDNISITCGVGHEPFVNDCKEVVAHESAYDGILVRGDRGRIAMVDIKRFQRRIVEIVQGFSKPVHVDDPRRSCHEVFPCHFGNGKGSAGGSFRETACTRPAVCPDKCRKTGDSPYCHGTVAVSRQTAAEADERRTCPGVLCCHPFDVRGGKTRYPAYMLRSKFGKDFGSELVEAKDFLPEELSVDKAVAIQDMHYPQCKGTIASGTDQEDMVGNCGCRSPVGIYQPDPGAPLSGLLDAMHEVD